MKRLKNFSNIFYLPKSGEQKKLVVIMPFAFGRLDTLENLLDSMLENGWRLEKLHFGFIFVFMSCKSKKKKHIILLAPIKRFKTDPHPIDVLRKWIPSFQSLNTYSYNGFSEYVYFLSHTKGDYRCYFYHNKNLDDAERDIVRRQRRKKVIITQLITSLLFLGFLTLMMYVFIKPNLGNRTEYIIGLMFIAIIFVIISFFNINEKREDS